MAEWRRIWHSFYGDAKVRRMSIKARYVYSATIVHADDDGVFNWDAEQIAADAHVSTAIATAAMTQILAAELVTVEGTIASHPNFLQWQPRAHASGYARASASTLTRATAGNRHTRKGEREKGRSSTTTTARENDNDEVAQIVEQWDRER
jgi:hypothetical protein